MIAATLAAPIDSLAPGTDDFTAWSDHKASARAAKAGRARNLSGRRHNIDPATCEREYTESEWEFMQAIQEYKQQSGRMFPTWSEVLEVLEGLGYRKSL